MFFVRSKKFPSALGAIALLLVALPAFVQASPKSDYSKRLRTATGDRREESLSKAKAQVFALLQNENACSAWFRESDSDPAGVFHSLHFQMEEVKPSYIQFVLDSHRRDVFKHPWVAQAWQLAGRDSTVKLNLDGAFFNASSTAVALTPGGGVARYLGFRMLTVGPFKGGTSEAQITTLLHELGHITDRIPPDDDSWDGKSSRNTEEVLLHCGGEIREFAKRNVGGRE